MTNLAGIILCGGASRRMGRDKAWLPFNGRPLLVHVVEIVSRSCAPVVVAAGPEQALPALPETSAIARDTSPHRGPLHGLAAALRLLPAKATGFFLCGCDAAFLSDPLIALLGERFDRCGSIVVPRVAGVVQPLVAVYPVDVRTFVDDLIARGESSLRAILDRRPVAFIDEAELRVADPDLGSFRPTNTPEEWRTLTPNHGTIPQ